MSIDDKVYCDRCETELSLGEGKVCKKCLEELHCEKTIDKGKDK